MAGMVLRGHGSTLRSFPLAPRNNTSEGGSVDPVDVDRGEAGAVPPSVVEVWALYGQRVLDVRHLGGARFAGASDCYTVGESHDVALVVPSAGLPSECAFTLVQGRTLNFTESMRGEVTDQGETLTLRALVRGGRASTCGSYYSYALGDGARCRVEHDAVTFFVNVVPPQEPIKLEFQTSRRFWAFNARSLALFASVLLPAYFATPSTGEGEVNVDRRLTQDGVVAFSSQPTLGAPESTPAAEREGGSLAQGSMESQAGGGGGDGDSARGGRGASGGSEVRAEWLNFAPSRDRAGEGGGNGGGRGRGSGDDPRGSETVALANPGDHPGDGRGAGDIPTSPASGSGDAATRRVSIDNSSRCETLDLLAVEATTPTHASKLMRVGPCKPQQSGGIPQMARNFDPDMMSRNSGILAAMQRDAGHFLASPYGSAFAVGNESDAEGPGPIGLGNIGLAGTGYGRGTGSRDHSPQGVPRVRQAKAQVKGNLDRDIIRRIVRAHINEVRFCYATGLARRPKMRGRVVVRFTIGPNGRVSASKVARSSLRDKRVASCISAAVRRWKFPKPQGGGDVVVTYPFVLGPG